MRKEFQMNARPHPQEREKNLPFFGDARISPSLPIFLYARTKDGTCDRDAQLRQRVPFLLSLPGGEGRGEGERLHRRFYREAKI